MDLGIGAGSASQDSTVVVGITSQEGRKGDLARCGQYVVRLNGSDPLVVTAELSQVDVAAGTAVMTALIDGVSWTTVIDREPGSTVGSAQTPGLWISECGVSWFFGQIGLNDRQQLGMADASGLVTSPMPGTVVAMMVTAGTIVVPGQPVAVVEAMKMEHTLKSGVDGVVLKVGAVTGDRVARGAVLVEIQPQQLAPLESLSDRLSDQSSDSGPHAGPDSGPDQVDCK
jgi:acetyl-CoA/propionyl-CoA carboxylase biotin carboxyl carrier protein